MYIMVHTMKHYYYFLKLTVYNLLKKRIRGTVIDIKEATVKSEGILRQTLESKRKT